MFEIIFCKYIALKYLSVNEVKDVIHAVMPRFQSNPNLIAQSNSLILVLSKPVSFVISIFVIYKYLGYEFLSKVKWWPMGIFTQSCLKETFFDRELQLKVLNVCFCCPGFTVLLSWLFHCCSGFFIFTVFLLDLPIFSVFFKYFNVFYGF